LDQHTINGMRYREQILKVFINQLDDEVQQFGYFQHDGATAHTTRANTASLQQFYDDCLNIYDNCQHFNPEWSARSLTSLL
jgi:hypothetical protein